MFALVDCNNFYASCERVFNPRLQGKPIVILSNNDGCIVARSQEVKDLEIPMGKPYFQMADLLKKHDVQVFSSNYTLYGDMSGRVMDVLCSLCPDIELYSIDEAFLELKNITDTPEEYGQLVRLTVKQWTGIPVSVGIGKTKTLAKVANKLAKKGAGVFQMPEDDQLVENILKDFPVGSVWGIGWRSTEFLKNRRITTALQFRNLPDTWIKKHLKIVGLRTAWELRGIACIELQEHIPDKQSIASTRSFGRSITTLQELEEAVSTYASRATEKLRRQKSLASIITIFIMTNRFKETDAQYANSITLSLPEPSNFTSAFIAEAKKGLLNIYRDGFRYKKAGIILSAIVPERDQQMNMFTPHIDHSKERHLMKAFDAINRSYGEGTIQLASSGIGKQWKMRREMRSPRYTTVLEELMVAKA